MAQEPVAAMPVAAEMMAVVIGLKQPMLLDDPGHLGAHVRPEDAGGDFGVIIGRQDVTDVVHQRRHDQLIVRAVEARPGGGLQRVIQTAHGISLEGMIEGLERAHDLAGEAPRELALRPVEQFVVLAGAVLHASEAHHRFHVFFLSGRS